MERTKEGKLIKISEHPDKFVIEGVEQGDIKIEIDKEYGSIDISSHESDRCLGRDIIMGFRIDETQEPAELYLDSGWGRGTDKMLVGQIKDIKEMKRYLNKINRFYRD